MPLAQRPAGTTKTDCTGLATHTVTAEDLKAGGFTPQIAYEVKAVEYAGKALSTPETIKGATSPVRANSLRVESITPSSSQENYKLGDTVTYTVRVRSVSDKTINVAATESSFDDLGRQCHWGGLKPGKAPSTTASRSPTRSRKPTSTPAAGRRRSP